MGIEINGVPEADWNRMTPRERRRARFYPATSPAGAPLLGWVVAVLLIFRLLGAL